MSMIINCHGKAIKKINLRKLLVDASSQLLNQLYEELKNLEIKTATHDQLDRLAGLYGWTHQNGLLVPITREELPVYPSPPVKHFNQRHRIDSNGKSRIRPVGRIGFTTSESIGVGVINPRAIAKLTKVSNEQV